MSEMKLTYFNARGRAELTRLLFAVGGKKYVDQRLSSEEWQKMKPSTPKGQLPVLEIDGHMICESMAIARFVARETGLYGSNNCEAAACDMLIDSTNEVVDGIVDKMFRAKTEEAKTAADERIKNSLDSLNKLLGKLKKGKFLLGDKPSVGDAAVFSMTEFLASAKIEFKADCCPTIEEIRKSFADHPTVAEHLKSRPETEF